MPRQRDQDRAPLPHRLRRPGGELKALTCEVSLRRDRSRRKVPRLHRVPGHLLGRLPQHRGRPAEHRLPGRQQVRGHLARRRRQPGLDLRGPQMRSRPRARRQRRQDRRRRGRMMEPPVGQQPRRVQRPRCGTAPQQPAQTVDAVGRPRGQRPAERREQSGRLVQRRIPPVQVAAEGLGVGRPSRRGGVCGIDGVRAVGGVGGIGDVGGVRGIGGMGGAQPRPVLDQGRGQHRDPAAELLHQVRQPVGHPPPERVAQPRFDSVLRPRDEPHLAVGPPRELPRRLALDRPVAEAEHDGQPRGTQPALELPEQRQRDLVGQMDVVDDDRGGFLASQVLKVPRQPSHRVPALNGLLSGVRPRGGTTDLDDASGALRHPVGNPGPGEQLLQDTAGERPLIGRTRGAQRPDARVGAEVRELLEQPGLPAGNAPAHQDQAPGPGPAQRRLLPQERQRLFRFQFRHVPTPEAPPRWPTWEKPCQRRREGDNFRTRPRRGSRCTRSRHGTGTHSMLSQPSVIMESAPGQRA